MNKQSSAYEVRVKGEKLPVFRSEILLQAEMVAIALTLSSLYGTHRTYEVVNVTTNRIAMTVTTDIAFAAMQTKMRNLIFNRKITKHMHYRPEPFTDIAHTKIVDAVRKGKSLDFVKDALYTKVDEYETYVRNQLSKGESSD